MHICFSNLLSSFTLQPWFVSLDVVGLIKHYQPLSELVNRLGNQQKQVKFIITDGRLLYRISLMLIPLFQIYALHYI